MRRPRVVIIGAGPSGASAALALRQLGAADVLVLDKSVYPRVKVCGSGLSPLALAVLDQLRLRDRFRARHAVIAGLWARGPDGGEVRFSAKSGKALKKVRACEPSRTVISSPSFRSMEGTSVRRPFTVKWPCETIMRACERLDANPRRKTTLSRRDSRICKRVKPVRPWRCRAVS